jgi:hypothetical protein
MPNCPECERLKYQIDIAAALSVEAAERVLWLDVDTPQCAAAVVAMRRAKLILEECELDYEEHVEKHTAPLRVNLAGTAA